MSGHGRLGAYHTDTNNIITRDPKVQPVPITIRLPPGVIVKDFCCGVAFTLLLTRMFVLFHIIDNIFF